MIRKKALSRAKTKNHSGNQSIPSGRSHRVSAANQNPNRRELIVEIQNESTIECVLPFLNSTEANRYEFGTREVLEYEECGVILRTL